jgi:hypothetical protein
LVQDFQQLVSSARESVENGSLRDFCYVAHASVSTWRVTGGSGKRIALDDVADYAWVVLTYTLKPKVLSVACSSCYHPFCDGLSIFHAFYFHTSAGCRLHWALTTMLHTNWVSWSKYNLAKVHRLDARLRAFFF